MLRILIITIALLLTSCAEYNKPQSHRFVALNTACSITVYSNKKIDLTKIEKIIREFEERVSFHKDDSQITKINKNSGKTFVELDKETIDLINKALNFGEISKGYFDPTIGPLSRLWGVGTKNYLPEDSEIEDVLTKVDYRRVKLVDNGVKLLDEGMELDLGGIAKGYISDKIKIYLGSIGVTSAIINLGGNICLIGDKKGERPWRVGVQSPSGIRGVEIGILEVEDVNIISSGAYERNFKKDGNIYHHIFDPYTGYPKDGDIISSTIVSVLGVDGDALSTITFGSTLDEVLKLKEIIDFEGIFVLKDDSIYITENLRDSFNLKDSRYRLIDDY